MVTRRDLWLDVTPDPKRATAAQLVQADASRSGEVVEVLDGGLVAVRLTGAPGTYPPVVAPAGGVTAVGATVRVLRDSTGRVSRVESPTVMPEGAEPVATGWESSRLLDSVTQGVLDEATEQLDHAIITLDYEIEQATLTANAAAQDALEALTAAAAAIVSTVSQYALGTETAAPVSGWSTTPPPREPGTFIWVRTTITYGDQTTQTSVPVLVTGNSGAPGEKGDRGEDGAGIEIAGSVATHANLPSGMGPGDAGKGYLVEADGLLYVWSGTEFPANGAGVAFRGPEGEPGAPGSPGAPGAQGVSVVSVTPYWRVQTTGSAAPAVPTTSPPPAPWVATEPAWMTNTELYRVDRVVYSNASFSYTTVSKVSAYTAATQAITVANLAGDAAKGMVKAQGTDPGQQEGRIWLVLDSAGRTIGIRISNGTSWSSYALMADQVIVPGSIGTILIGDNQITAPKIVASEALSAKVATFLEVTTEMLLAGNATITNQLMVDELIGKTITGPIIRTSALPSVGIKLDEGGIRTYNDDGGYALLDSGLLRIYQLDPIDYPGAAQVLLSPSQLYWPAGVPEATIEKAGAGNLNVFSGGYLTLGGEAGTRTPTAFYNTSSITGTRLVTVAGDGTLGAALGLPKRWQTGTAPTSSAVAANGGAVTISINFTPGLFTASPRLFVNSSSARCTPRVDSTSTSGASVTFYNWTGANAAAFSFDWFAFQ